ncbi:MAG: copper homeostasis membrane protein CopD [Hyphomicrobiales bacterium]
MEIDVPLVLARWLHFASLMIVFGASLFPLYALPPSLGGEATPALAKADRYVRPASYLALASAIAWVALSLTTMTGDPASLADRDTLVAFFTQTSFGPVWLLRLALLIVLAVVVVAWSKHNPTGRRLAQACLAGASLASQAWLGHAAMATGAKLGSELVAYVTHVVAASAWIGGLLPLGYVLAHARRLPGDDCARACHAILVRYSGIAMIAVALVIASGIANSVFRLQSANDLVATAYGITILGKALLLACALAAASFNRWWLMPRIERGSTGAVDALRRNIVIEQVLLTLVVGAASVLGTLPP